MKSAWFVWVFAVCLVTPAAALAGERSDREILREYDGLRDPSLPRDKQDDPAIMKQYIAKRAEIGARRNALIFELYKSNPDHIRIPVLMSERWGRIEPDHFNELFKEVDEVLANYPSPKLKVEGTFFKAQGKLWKSRSVESLDLSGVDEFIELAPKDPRGVRLLSTAAQLARDAKTRTALEVRILKDFPNTLDARLIERSRHQLGMIGKPFELEFVDAIKGSPVSMKNLKGKVVVIDFWATWCGPCVVELPAMKTLYAKYRDRGVEFIGVSLDEPRERGGLEKLRKFVEEKKIAWPQYYQGKGWESEFSSSLGIDAIPSVFVVDPDGRLYSTQARGKLGTIIPDLLERKGATVGAATDSGS